MKKKTVKNIVIILMMFFLVASLNGCSLSHAIQSKDPLSRTELLMDTVVTITIYGWEPVDTKGSETDVDRILAGAIDRCKALEQQFSITKEGDIRKLNHQVGEMVSVEESTIELLQIGEKYEALSGGMLSMKIGSLSTLWDFHEEESYLPSQDEILRAKLAMEAVDLVWKDGQAGLLWKDPTDKLQENGENTQPKLDVGAIAKGYIADCLKEYLVENGVTSAIINLGGNVLTIGCKPDGSSFAIGIQKPFSDENDTAIGVRVADSSVVTAGVYQRYFERDGNIYHHILDPATGYPVETDLYSATILSNESVDGDAISTICMLLGKEKAMEFVEDIGGVEAILITNEQQVYTTSGIEEDQLIR